MCVCLLRARQRKHILVAALLCEQITSKQEPDTLKYCLKGMIQVLRSVH